MKIRMYVVIFHAQEPEEEDTFIIQEMRSSGSFCKLPKVIKLLSDRVLSWTQAVWLNANNINPQVFVFFFFLPLL